MPAIIINFFYCMKTSNMSEIMEPLSQFFSDHMRILHQLPNSIPKNISDMCFLELEANLSIPFDTTIQCKYTA
jgi:hypothetical protein